MTMKIYNTHLFLVLAIGINSFAQPGNISNASSDVYISSINDLTSLRLLYDLSDLPHPSMIFNKDTVDISQFVRVSRRNSDILKKTETRPKDYIRSSKNVGIQDHIPVNNYLICLSEEVIGKDILIWKNQNNKYSLLAIYPSEVAVCLYCEPKFYTSNIDTFSVGTVNQEEGDVYGGYSYYTIENDTLHLSKEIFANGSCPFNGESNPIDSVTCISYLTIKYASNGVATSSSIRYECQHINGENIYGHSLTDSLSLFKMYWQGIGPLLKRVKAGNEHFRVGSSVNNGGRFYIAIEYDNQWYWALKKDIKIE